MRRKQLYLLSLLLVLALAFTACGSAEDEGTINQEPAVGQEEVAGVDLTAEPTEEVADQVTGEVEQPTATVATEAMTETETSQQETTEQETISETPALTETEPLTGSTTVTEPSEEVTTDELVEGDTGLEGEVIPPTGAVNVDYLSNVVDFEIHNYNDEQIGDIKAVVIDMDRSEIKYVVAGVGGFLGIGEKSVAIPYQALHLNQVAADGTSTDEMSEPSPNVFVVDIDAESPENAPELDLSLIENPVDTTDEITTAEEAQTATDNTQPATLAEQEQQIQAFWEGKIGSSTSDGESSTTMSETTTADSQMSVAGAAHYVLADSLLRARVVNGPVSMNQENKDLNGEESSQMATDASPISAAASEGDLGQVQEIVIDANSGKVNDLLIDLNEAAVSPEEQAGSDQGVTDNLLTVVPLNAFQWNAQEETLFFNGNQPLQDAPTITYDEFYSGNLDWENMKLNDEMSTPE